MSNFPLFDEAVLSLLSLTVSLMLSSIESMASFCFSEISFSNFLTFYKYMYICTIHLVYMYVLNCYGVLIRVALSFCENTVNS